MLILSPQSHMEEMGKLTICTFQYPLKQVSYVIFSSVIENHTTLSMLSIPFYQKLKK